MQEPTNKQSGPPEDAISLSAIRNFVLDFFSILFNGLFYVGRMIKKTLWVFILCCLGGLTVGYLNNRSHSSDYYITQMIVYSSELLSNDYTEIINNLNNLVYTQSYDVLEKELELKPEIVKAIRGFKVIKLNTQSSDKENKDIGDRNQQLFKIQAQLNTIMPPEALQNALLYYLNNKPFFKQRKEGQKKIFQDKLAFIEREQQKLDSLKSLYNAALAAAKLPPAGYNSALNPADIYAQSDRLADQKDSILRWLNNESEAVILIDGMKTPFPVVEGSLLKSLLKGLAGGILLGLLVAVLAAISAEVRNRRLTTA